MCEKKQSFFYQSIVVGYEYMFLDKENNCFYFWIFILIKELYENKIFLDFLLIFFS